ncbi:hypothetical protein GUJ93_ZPchr0007g5880 [Zizania palustris]|uniref:Uncharacterized protein n=1 Tax=Zizania palustris TaxID=103762 RepID=A0A8J5SL27_ZIZPA|nr:hypothetical protein GUJ93_ZPchr0007g5880 [Zizania palustris]
MMEHGAEPRQPTRLPGPRCACAAAGWERSPTTTCSGCALAASLLSSKFRDGAHAHGPAAITARCTVHLHRATVPCGIPMAMWQVSTTWLANLLPNIVVIFDASRLIALNSC